MAAIKLINEAVQGVKFLAAFIQANREEAWFKASSETFINLRNTVNDPKLTDAERTAKLRDAGSSIRDLIGKL